MARVALICPDLLFGSRLHSALQHGLVFYQAQRYLDRTAPEGVAFAAALIDLGYLERDHDDHNQV